MKTDRNHHTARLTLTGLGVAALLLLTACAPAAGQSSAPVPVSAGPVPASAGQRLFVRVDSSLEAFGLKPGDMTPALWVPLSYDAEKGNVGSYFGLQDVQAAPGWEVKLSEVQLERSTRSGSTTYDLWASLRLSVPEDAIPGVYRVRATLQARNGARQPVEFRVDVRR